MKKIKGFAFLYRGENISLVANRIEENPPLIYMIFPTKTAANREQAIWESEQEIREVEIIVKPPPLSS